MEEIQNETEFGQFWAHYKTVVLMLAILADNDLLAEFYPLSNEQSEVSNYVYSDIERQLMRLFRNH